MVFQGTQGEPTKLDELTVKRDVDAGSLTGSLAGGGKIRRLLGAGLTTDSQELTIDPGAGLSVNNDDLNVTASFSGVSGISNPLTADLDADGFDINNLRRLGVEELSDEKPITINQTQIGDQLIPSGEIVTGPQSTSLNAEASVLAEAPVNADATQGTESVIKMLESGIDPTLTVSRTLDGEGGAYANQFDAPLGRFARLNANLSFNRDTLSDTSFSASSATSSFNIDLNNRPRRLSISHDGSGDGFGGASSSVLVDRESLESFRITFGDVSFTNNSPDNRLRMGLADGDPSDDILNSSQNAIYVVPHGIEVFRAVTAGSQDYSTSLVPRANFSQNRDISIEIEPNVQRALIGGEVVASESNQYSTTADFNPFIQINDNANSSDGETVEVGQITVEPIGGTF
jgi:hypothetical protein